MDLSHPVLNRNEVPEKTKVNHNIVLEVFNYTLEKRF